MAPAARAKSESIDVVTEQRRQLACAFRWAARLDLHEAVANHFSLAVSADGSEFLINPNQVHFGHVTASSLLLLNANEPTTLESEDAPDLTAWGLHGSIHRQCTHVRCVMHVHSKFATILASLEESTLPPIDQNTATFFNRHTVDNSFDGLAFEEEGERCAQLLLDTENKVIVMGNHGLLVVGSDVADTFNRLYHFERAAENYVGALWTGKPLRVMPDDVAEKTARAVVSYPGQAQRHFAELRAILDDELSNYAE